MSKGVAGVLEVKVMREKVTTCLNMDEPENKRRLMSKVGTLTGWWEVELSPRRNTRSLQQLRYYWSCVSPALYTFLRQCGWDLQHKGEAHDWAKQEFLKFPIVNKRTGEVVSERIGSTGELDTEGMGNFIERVRQFLAENNVPTPDPDPCWRDNGKREVSRV